MIGSNENGFYMPVAPAMYGGNGNNGGFGNGDWGMMWLILLIIFCGWGNNNNNGGGFGGGNGSMNGAFPWLLNADNRTLDAVTTGFDNAAVMSQLGDINGSITNGFSNLEVSNCNRAINQLQTEYQNQIASMNQRFADTTAMNAQMNALSMGLQNCCCENRSSIADLKYTVATEACADRNAVNMGVRDVLTNNTSNTQAVLDAIRGINDKLCDQELQAERRENNNLRSQLQMAQLQASQTAQTAAIRAGQVAEIDAMYQRLKDCPVPTQPVYGSQPIFTCPNNYYNNGCGCGAA